MMISKVKPGDPSKAFAVDEPLRTATDAESARIQAQKKRKVSETRSKRPTSSRIFRLLFRRAIGEPAFELEMQNIEETIPRSDRLKGPQYEDEDSCQQPRVQTHKI
jgi:hypothetical protein